MSVLTHLPRIPHRTRDSLLLTSPAGTEAKKGETAWCLLSFLLFLALGPFAAVPALLGIFSLLPGDETAEPRPLDE